MIGRICSRLKICCSPRRYVHIDGEFDLHGAAHLLGSQPQDVADDLCEREGVVLQYVVERDDFAPPVERAVRDAFILAVPYRADEPRVAQAGDPAGRKFPLTGGIGGHGGPSFETRSRKKGKARSGDLAEQSGDLIDGVSRVGVGFGQFPVDLAGLLQRTADSLAARHRSALSDDRLHGRGRQLRRFRGRRGSRRPASGRALHGRPQGSRAVCSARQPRV